MKSFFNETLIFFFRKFWASYILEKCKSSTNLVAEIYQKLWNKRSLSTGEPCTCEYVTLLQSFHKGTLSIHWYIAQNFQPTFSMSVLFRCSFKTAIFSRFFRKISYFVFSFSHIYIYIYIYIYLFIYFYIDIFYIYLFLYLYIYLYIYILYIFINIYIYYIHIYIYIYICIYKMYI